MDNIGNDPKEIENLPLAQTLHSEVAYDAGIFRVMRDEVLLPNGIQRINHVVRLPQAVSIIAVNDQDEIGLLLQYRYPFNEYLWEIPAGMIDDGESPCEAASRELQEELGFKCSSLDQLLGFYQLCSVADPRMSIFVARDVTRVSTLHDEGEVIKKIRFISLREAERMIHSGRIKNGYTILAILLLARERGGKLQELDLTP